MAAAARAKPMTRPTATVVKPRPAQTPKRRTRSAPRRRQPQRARARSTAPTGLAAVPAAFGMTAHAVGDLADSRLVHRLTGGRWWIFTLGTLLSGIVALNLYALSFNATSAVNAAEADDLAQANSVLQSRIAKRLSSAKVEGSAAALGLLLPAPDAVTYLTPSGKDAALAAERLSSGEIALGGITIPGADVTQAGPIDPAPGEIAIDPVAAEPVVAAPEVTDPGVVAAPAAPDPTTQPTISTDPTAGGVAP